MSSTSLAISLTKEFGLPLVKLLIKELSTKKPVEQTGTKEEIGKALEILSDLSLKFPEFQAELRKILKDLSEDQRNFFKYILQQNGNVDNNVLIAMVKAEADLNMSNTNGFWMAFTGIVGTVALGAAGVLVAMIQAEAENNKPYPIWYRR